MNGAQQQIYKMLAEVLGGINFVKASVLTPYYYTIGKCLVGYYLLSENQTRSSCCGSVVTNLTSIH